MTKNILLLFLLLTTVDYACAMEDSDSDEETRAHVAKVLGFGSPYAESDDEDDSGINHVFYKSSRFQGKGVNYNEDELEEFKALLQEEGEDTQFVGHMDCYKGLMNQDIVDRLRERKANDLKKRKSVKPSITVSSTNSKKIEVSSKCVGSKIIEQKHAKTSNKIVDCKTQ